MVRVHRSRQAVTDTHNRYAIANHSPDYSLGNFVQAALQLFTGERSLFSVERNCLIVLNNGSVAVGLYLDPADQRFLPDLL